MDTVASFFSLLFSMISFARKTACFLSFLILVTCSCRNLKDPVFEEMESMKLGKVGIGETTVSADLRFNNPNSFGLRLRQINCDLYIDSSYVGRFSNSEEVRVPARAQFILPVSGQARTMELLKYSGIAALSGKAAAVRIKGTARVSKAGIIKTIPVDYSDSILLKF